MDCYLIDFQIVNKFSTVGLIKPRSKKLQNYEKENTYLNA